MNNIKENIGQVYKNIRNAYSKFHIKPKQPQDTKLIAVSKRQPTEKIQTAIEAGHLIYGENKVQEGYEHFEQLKQNNPKLELHFIGGLQTNKVKDCINLFDAIHTIDREKLAKEIAKELLKNPKDIKLFIQVNTGEEEQKSGILPNDADEFIIYCINELKLNIAGLMCIPPANDNPALHFTYLKKLADKHNLTELSMGMSADYELATALGATYVRVGTDVFGKRD